MINLFNKRRVITTFILLVTISINSSISSKKSLVLSTPSSKPITNNVSPENIKKADDENLISKRIEEIYNIRNNAFVNGNLKNISKYFDTSEKYGVIGLEHEIKRVKYLRAWAEERKFEFKKVSSKVLIKRIKVFGNIANIFLAESYRFDYNYPEKEDVPVTSFGVGIRHSVKMINKSGNWVIYYDWYTDCFEDALGSFSGSAETQASNIDVVNISAFSTFFSRTFHPYNRTKAALYADKYCGAAWGNGNNYKYNAKYSDYNGAGGDCTNFASQCLGDEEGGGIAQNYTWRCIIPKWGCGCGSKAWVNADGFKNYLIYSGRGSLIMKGTFKELTTPIASSKNGSVGKLKLGDLVCYEKKGDIDHFAIITGFDPEGYPLINSHTTDRYHVPWDLGWGDKHIKFLLIHIN